MPICPWDAGMDDCMIGQAALLRRDAHSVEELSTTMRHTDEVDGRGAQLSVVRKVRLDAGGRQES